MAVDGAGIIDGLGIELPELGILVLVLIQRDDLIILYQAVDGGVEAPAEQIQRVRLT